MFKSILNTFANCLKIPELKSRLIFTVAVLAICRICALIPTPELNSAALTEFLKGAGHADQGGLMGMYSMFTGGGFEKCAVGALGIMPYISATIIIQLLGAVYGPFAKLAREEGGRIKLIQYGRVLTLVLCLGQGFVMAMAWEHPASIWSGFPGQLILPGTNLWMYRFQTAIILSTGTMLMMWLGEQISERGIGNGVSLIITIGILARLPQGVTGAWEMFFAPAGQEATHHKAQMIVLVGLLAGVIAVVVAITQAQRKIPVQYAQRMVGRKMYSGGSSYMPLRVNYPGVMPVIFAQSLLMFPTMILSSIGQRFGTTGYGRLAGEVAALLNRGTGLYLLCYGLLILFFSYFWVATQFNELQIADDMKKSGGYIPGVRPGTPTSDFLHRSMSRITLAGAIFLTGIAVFPTVLGNAMNVPYTVTQFFGGTSLLIIVGVLLDTMRQMEAHLLMRHYDGFLKKGRLKGRF